MRINPENKSLDMEHRDINYILPPYIRNYMFMNKNEMPEKIIFPMFASVMAGGKEIPIEYIAAESPVAVEIAEDGAAVPEITPAQEAVLDERDEEIKRLKAEVEALTITGGRGEDEVGGTTDVTPEEPAITPAPEDLVRQQEEYEAEHGDAPRRPEGSVSPAKAAFAHAAEERIETATPYAKTATELAKEAERIPKQPPGGDIGAGQSPSDMHPRDARDQAMTAKALQPEADISEAEEKPFEKEIKRDEAGKPIVEDKPDVAD